MDWVLSFAAVAIVLVVLQLLRNVSLEGRIEELERTAASAASLKSAHDKIRNVQRDTLYNAQSCALLLDSLKRVADAAGLERLPGKPAEEPRWAKKKGGK